MNQRAFLLPWLLLAGFGFSPAAAAVTDLEVGHDWEQDDTRAASDRSHQAAHARAKMQGVYAARVRYVRVEGRWMGGLDLPLKPGDQLTPQKLFDAMEAVAAGVSAGSVENHGLRSAGEIGVLYVGVDFDRSAPPDIGVILRPYYVQLSLTKIGDNFLPLPRSPHPTLIQNVPKPLLALQPAPGVFSDRSLGTALGGTTKSHLLDWFHASGSSQPDGENQHLDLVAQGMKSLDESFYRAAAALSYGLRHDGENFQGCDLGVNYDGAKEPLAGAARTRQDAGVSGGLDFKPAPNTRLNLAAGYQRVEDRTPPPAGGPVARTSIDQQFNRVLLDAIPRPLYGFLRAAVWEDNGDDSAHAGSYHRFAGRIGYAKEIPLAPSQAIGFEALAGAGKITGTAPAGERFFGGNSTGQFLYDSPASPSLLHMPAGPLIRSFGEGEASLHSGAAGPRGGEAYWHLNLNLSFPIPAWSRALFPNEATNIPDVDGNPLTVKKMLKQQIDVTGPSMLASVLAREGLTAGAAEARAAAILEEVRPASHFIIDDANLYSFKPLVMLDAAGMSGGPGTTRERWLAAGGGFQLTVVTARFEAGCMHTLTGHTVGRRDNVFVRLVFQNLF